MCRLTIFREWLLILAMTNVCFEFLICVITNNHAYYTDIFLVCQKLTTWSCLYEPIRRQVALLFFSKKQLEKGKIHLLQQAGRSTTLFILICKRPTLGKIMWKGCLLLQKIRIFSTWATDNMMSLSCLHFEHIDSQNWS